VVVVFLVVNSSFAAACRGPERADLIIHNARIHTVDLNNPTASAIAVRGDRIAAVGRDDAVLRLQGDATRVIDAGGAAVVPGLHDAHGHFTGLGERLQVLDLRGTASYDEVVARVRDRLRTAAPGDWIEGRGWDQNDWPDAQWPTHHALSAASPDHPVYLTRIDGHAGLANARAMTAAGITRTTRDPDGGRIVRDASGTPSGVFVDAAEHLITSRIPPPSTPQVEEQILRADAETRRLGLTMIHDAGVPGEVVEVYRRLIEAGRVKTRLYVMLGGSLAELTPAFQRGPVLDDRNHRLTVRAVKVYVDGALGSRGAALLEPYEDEPGTSGLIRTSPGDLYALTAAAARAGFQPAIHAIGDRGNRLALDAFDRVQRDVPDARRLRMRVEHAQILDARDIPRFANLGVIASMQPTHATSDMPWVPARLGSSRMEEGAYVWRRLLDSGATIVAGSDFPVEEANPLLGFYAAVTRQDAEGHPPGGWMPRERMTREQALRAFTFDAAYAAHAEQLLGSLQEGKLADLVMLSKDIMTVAPQEILATEVRLTVVGGEIVFERRQ
jgi:predicted amidohydrolase YtcJ